MRRLLSVIAALMLPVPLAAQAANADGSAWVNVTADESGAAAHVVGGIDIAAPPEVVWRVMTDCANAYRLLTNLKSCRITQGDMAKGWDVREHVTGRNLVFPGLRIVFRSDYTPYSKIAFRLVEGDLKSEDGAWTLAPINGGAGTRVGYDNRLSAKSAFAPGVLVRQALRKDTPQALNNLKAAVMGGKAP